MAWRQLAERYPRLGSFVDRRFDAEHAFGRHLTVALVLALAGIGFFAVITLYATAGPESVAFDNSWNAFLNRHAVESATLTTVFTAITWLGNTLPLAAISGTVLVVLIALGLRRKECLLLAAIWVITTTGGALLNEVLKGIFQRHRPSLNVIHAGGWSFPSGHASGGMVVYGMLAYLLLRVATAGLARKAILVGAVLLVGLIGFSRVYLGAHWPSDVLGGWTVGATWLALCISTAEVVRRQHAGARDETLVPPASPRLAASEKWLP